MSLRKFLLAPFVIPMILLSVLSIFWSAVYAQGADTTGIQTALMNPWVLYALMIFGSILSMVKQFGTAKMDGSAVTVGGYLSHAQEILTTLGANTIAFFALASAGHLDFVSAVSIGYVINSVSDLNPAGGRSTSLK